MKLLIVSDIHTEFHKDGGISFLDKIKSDPDICIVAGDLCSFREIEASVELVSKRFKEVVYVYGNHEAYHGSIPEVKEKINKIKPDNFHFLDNSFVEIGGQRFIGACLWCRWDPTGHFYRKNMSDFSLIKNANEDIYEENEKSINYLENNVKEGDIVVTHHLPSNLSVHSKYKNSVLNYFFVCEMDQMILEEKPKLWVHGHTHESCDYILGETRVVCNPFGYAGYELNNKFKELEIEI